MDRGESLRRLTHQDFADQSAVWTYQGCYRLERETGAELDLARRRCGFRDGAELRRIQEPVRCPQVGVIEGVIGLAPNLELRPLGHGELPLQCNIEQLHTGPIDGISSGIAESICRGHAESRRVEPLVGGAGARSENRLSRIVCPYGILP